MSDFCDQPTNPANDSAAPTFPQPNRECGPMPGFKPVECLPATVEHVREITKVQECCPPEPPAPVPVSTTGANVDFCGGGISFRDGLLKSWPTNSPPIVSFTSLDQSVNVKQEGCTVDLSVTIPGLAPGANVDKCGTKIENGIIKQWASPLYKLAFEANTGLTIKSTDPETCTVTIGVGTDTTSDGAASTDVLYTHYTCCSCSDGTQAGPPADGPVITWITRAGAQYRVNMCDTRASGPGTDFNTLEEAKSWMKALVCIGTCGSTNGGGGGGGISG
jgi:hypothetical protein